MKSSVKNFITLDSVHGPFIINRHACVAGKQMWSQSGIMVRTGATHIEYEISKILTVIKILLAEDSGPVIAVDAGANAGFVSVPVAHALKAHGGMVHSYEPQRMLCNALCGTVALNDLSNLHVHRLALGAENGEIKVPDQNYSQSADFGRVSLVDQEMTKADAFETVPLRRIDDLGHARLDFLKVDVEGMEIAVLSGARRSIEAHRPWCWIEHFLTDADALRNRFKALDYEMFVMGDQNILAAPSEKLAASSLVIRAEKF